MPDLTRILPEARIPELPNPYFGKVRDCYDLSATAADPARRVLISSDRISAFDRLDHVRGWTGLYELSPDNSALLGAVPGLDNAFEIHSFSGRGVMQSWAAALCLAELITDGAFATFPRAELLSAARFDGGELQPEELHI